MENVRVTHILKDGTVLDSIAGHVVRYEDCPELYRLIGQMARKRKQKELTNTKKEETS
ncbi:MAG: hypothetical protein LUH45_06780 [Clostridiales bacterium]|nr:hypothetical protein [Clostridiales bacterium]